jgi:molybdate transport system permease protein
VTEYEITALLLSLKVALTAVLWLIPSGTGLAWLLARKNFPCKGALDSIIHLPLVLPPVVIGYLLLIGMGKKGVIGAVLNEYLGFSFSFSWRGAALASAVVALPLMVRAIRLSLESVDPKLEQAARTLGAGSVRIFFTVTLPLTLPGIVTGTMLSFARSLGEFGATISFVSNIPGETQTIPLAMYQFIETPGAELETARLCLISIVIALLSLLVSNQLSKRTQQRLGYISSR